MVRLNNNIKLILQIAYTYALEPQHRHCEEYACTTQLGILTTPNTSDIWLVLCTLNRIPAHCDRDIGVGHGIHSPIILLDWSKMH